MIFLVQFGINKHLLIFSKTTNCTRPTGSCNFVSLKKNLLVLIYSKLHSKSLWLPIQINYFYTWCGRFASQHNYDKLSRIFSCILLTHNHTIFHVQFGINKQLLIFSKTTNCSRPTGWWNFVSLWNFYLCLLVPNCTLNHVITYKKSAMKRLSYGHSFRI